MLDPSYKKRRWLSISTLLDFSRCPRRYFFKGGIRLESPEPHPALKFGEAIHNALPHALDDSIDVAMRAFMRVWGEGDSQFADKKRNSTRAEAMLKSFRLSQLPPNGLLNLRPCPSSALSISDRVSPYEIPVAIDVGIGVPIVARLDGWAHRRGDPTESTWIVEYKTTSELSSRFANMFGASPQLLTYALCLEALTGEQVAGAFVVGLLVSTSRSETILVPVEVKRWQLASALQWLQSTGSALLHCEETGVFPTDYAGCTPYPQFGTVGYTCEYYDLCHLMEDWKEGLRYFKKGTERVFDLVAEAPVKVA